MPRGDSPASRENLKRSNKSAAGKAGGTQKGINAAERRAAIAAAGEMVVTSPLAHLENTMSELAIYCARVLKDANKTSAGRLEPADAAIVKEFRQTIITCQSYRDQLSSDAPLQLFAAELVKRLADANISVASPDAPEDEPEEVVPDDAA